MHPDPAIDQLLCVAVDEEIESIVDTWTNHAATARARKAATTRSRGRRPRFVDPTTCERDYSADELEFLQAIQAYKARCNRPFPTWSEALKVLRGLGYAKVATGLGVESVA